MKKTYHKLIRDKIPEIIEAQGQCCIVKKLSYEEYLEMVDAKLDEELAEFHKDQSLEERDTLIAAGWEYQGIGWYSCWK